MALELCYTSAPKGLLPHTHGFCTVAASADLSRPMIERLESLSGYRPMFGVGDERAEQNPVAWSHLRLNVGGATRSVLSRVAYSGADYSGRTNKFAHHVLVDDIECAAAGPAWLIEQPGVMRRDWNQPPQAIEAPRALPAGDVSPCVCTLWQQATGDAGWAGVLAEWQLLDPAQPAYLIFDPAQHDPLALTAEAVALLPPAHRWGVTFTTYHTDPVGDAQCAWRWVALGTPMAETARTKAPADRLIDLTQPMPGASESRYVQLARNGHEQPPSAVDQAASNSSFFADQAAIAAVAPPAPDSAAPQPNTTPANDHHEPPVSSAAQSAAEPPSRPRSTPRMRGLLIAAAIAWPLLVLGGTALWRTTPTATGQAPPPNATPPQQVARLQEQLAQQEKRAEELSKQLQDTQTKLRQTQQALNRKTANEDDASSNTKALAVEPNPKARAPEESSGAPTARVSNTTPSQLPKNAAPNPQERRFVAMDPPRFETSSSTSLGSTPRLIASQLVLVPAADLPQAHRVTAVSGLIDGDHQLRLTHDALGVRLEHTRVDALGNTQPTVLGQARLEPPGLVWHWRQEQYNNTADPKLDFLNQIVQCAVFQLRTEQGDIVAEVQPSLPSQVDVSTTGSPSTLPQSPSGLDLIAKLADAPSGWRLAETQLAQQIVLVGPNRAELHIQLHDATDAIAARWSDSCDPEAVTRRLLYAQRDHDHFENILDQHKTLKATVDELEDKLPRDKEGEVDYSRRDVPRHVAGFREYAEAQDELELFEAEHLGPAMDLKAMKQQSKQLAKQIKNERATQDQVRDFRGATIKLIAPRSTAEFAVLQIKGGNGS